MLLSVGTNIKLVLQKKVMMFVLSIIVHFTCVSLLKLKLLFLLIQYSYCKTKHLWLGTSFSVILVEFMSNLLYLLECSWPNILRVFISNTRPYRHPYLSFLKLKRFWEKDFLKDEPIEYKNWVILIKLFSLSFAEKSKLNSKLICSFSLLSDTSFKSIHQTIKKVWKTNLRQNDRQW